MEAYYQALLDSIRNNTVKPKQPSTMITSSLKYKLRKKQRGIPEGKTIRVSQYKTKNSVVISRVITINELEKINTFNRLINVQINQINQLKDDEVIIHFKKESYNGCDVLYDKGRGNELTIPLDVYNNLPTICVYDVALIDYELREYEQYS